MLKIVDNKDTELRDEAELKLKENKKRFGKRYCPCTINHTEDTICPCKEFREQSVPGECHCGRYMKIEIFEKDVDK